MIPSYLEWSIRLNSTAYTGESYKSKPLNAQLVNPASNRGLFSVDMKSKSSIVHGKPNLFVVHVDSNFAFVYYCENTGFIKFSLGWVLSREQIPNPTALKKFEKKLSKMDLIDLNRMRLVDQILCPPNPLSPLNLPGVSLSTLNGVRTLPVDQLSSETKNDLEFVRCVMQITDTFFYDLLYCRELSDRRAAAKKNASSQNKNLI